MSSQARPFALSGRTAFVTGAASGIGGAFARALKAEGMNVAMADVNTNGLAQAAEALGGDAAGVQALTLDVTDRGQFANARDAALERFGGVDLLCNIAGVGGATSIEAAEFNDWDWILGVNLGGVINGVVTFLPALKARADGAWIVNMGSILSTYPQPGPPGIYGVTKQAVLALSDSLRWSLAEAGVGVTTVCPGFVDTAIARSEQTRPARFAVDREVDAEHQAFFEQLLKDSGMSPDEVARRAIAGVKARAPYVMTHPEFRGPAEVYANAVLDAYGAPEDIDDARRAAAAGAEEMIRALTAATRS